MTPGDKEDWMREDHGTHELPDEDQSSEFMSADNRMKRWFAGTALIATIVVSAWLLLSLRACDESATITCPNGTKVTYQSHGNGYSNGVPNVGDVCGPGE